jgi:hypothetical protein
MRCDCCNRPLNDFEATLKSAATGEFLNTCRICLSDLGIETMGRDDLNPDDDVEEDFEWDDFEVEDEGE